MGGGLWAPQVLASPLLRRACLAADVAPGPARILVWVPAVAVVADAWEGREGAVGRGRDGAGTAAATRPPPGADTHQPGGQTPGRPVRPAS